MKAPGQLVLGQHVIVGPPVPLDALLLDPPPTPLDDELLDDELLDTLLDDELLDDELLDTLLDDELPAPEPPAPVEAELLLELPLPELVAAAPELLELVVELDPVVPEPFVVAPGPLVTDEALAPPKPPLPAPLLSDVSSLDKPFAQATAMTKGQATQRSFKPRTQVV